MDTAQQPGNARDFIAKWGPGGPAHTLNERAGSHTHFLDRCQLLALNLARSQPAAAVSA